MTKTIAEDIDKLHDIAMTPLQGCSVGGIHLRHIQNLVDQIQEARLIAKDIYGIVVGHAILFGIVCQLPCGSLDHSEGSTELMGNIGKE